MIRVVIADDHHLVRQGIRALLERGGGIDVVGEAADGLQALEIVERLRPDVLLIDIAMPLVSGIEALERIQLGALPTRTVIISMHSDEIFVRQALRAGASGYLLKRSVAEELLLAVRAANEGNTYLSPEISKLLMGDLLSASDEASSPVEQLTLREREVLKLVAEGHTNSAIASTLHVSVKTVEKHRANLMTKLNLHDVTGLIRFAIKHGLISVND